MTASRHPRISRCSALSRSFLLGPSGPAGAAPGQRLRSGSYMAASRKRNEQSSSIQKCPRFQGKPVINPRSLAVVLAMCALLWGCPALTDRADGLSGYLDEFLLSG
jgi:hypothetical protein